MPLPIQLQRFARALTKRMGIQGHLPLTLVEDVQAVLALADVTDPLAIFVRGEQLWWAGNFSIAVAGQQSSVLYENPAGSTVIVVVEHVAWEPGAAADVVRIGTRNTAIGIAAANHNPMDSRFIPYLTSVLAQSVLRSGTLQQVGNVLTTAHYGRSGNAVLELPIILVPGTTLLVENFAANSSLRTAVTWREVPLAPQEMA